MKRTLIFILFFQIIGCNPPSNTNIKQEEKPDIKLNNTLQIKKILKGNGLSQQQTEQVIKNNPKINTILKNQLQKLINESKNGNKIDINKLLYKIKNHNDDLPQDFINKHGKYIVRGKAYLTKGKHKFIIGRLNERDDVDVFINGIDVTEKCKIENLQISKVKDVYRNFLVIDIDQPQNNNIDVIICFKSKNLRHMQFFCTDEDTIKLLYDELNFKYFDGLESPDSRFVFYKTKIKKITYRNDVDITDEFALPSTWKNEKIQVKKNNDETTTYTYTYT